MRKVALGLALMMVMAGCVTKGGNGIPLTKVQKAKQSIVIARLVVSTSIAAITIITEGDDPEKLAKLTVKIEALITLAEVTVNSILALSEMSPEVAAFADGQIAAMNSDVQAAVAAAGIPELEPLEP